MLTYNTLFEKILQETLQEVIDGKKNDLAIFRANPDYATYAYNAGVIAGLEEVKDLIKEAQTKVSSRS